MTFLPREMTPELDAKIRALQLPPDVQEALSAISTSISTETAMQLQKQHQKFEYLVKASFYAIMEGNKGPNRAARRQQERQAQKLNKKGKPAVTHEAKVPPGSGQPQKGDLAPGS